MLTQDLSPEAAYAALAARDARFDGRLYVGVTSTGVYCRPVCRVRLPRRENCRFFASAAQAEAAAFRPCLKCRPELAPRPLAWTTTDASRTLAAQAAAWLDECGNAQASVEDVAAHLGVSSRHLRRIFIAEHGVTPLQYLQTRRLLLAKALLTDTSLPVAQVALAAGYASVRSFNAAFAGHYRLAPSALRRARGPETACGEPALRLGYRPPLAVDALLRFLAARSMPGVEQVDLEQRTLSRSLRLRHAGAWITGRLVLRFDVQRSQVLLSPCSALWGAVGSLVPLVRRWLDLDADPEAIDAGLGALAADLPGLRLPGCVDRFELMVRAVLGQQVTVAAARTLAGRVVERFGDELSATQVAPGVQRLFPTAERIARAGVSELAELGLIRRRAEALIAIAQRWPALEPQISRSGPDASLELLCQLPGVGPWTASYMLMRGWSWPDAFPPGDVVLRRMLSPVDAAPLSPSAYALAAERFRPYRSYAVLHLWNKA